MPTTVAVTSHDLKMTSVAQEINPKFGRKYINLALIMNKLTLLVAIIWGCVLPH